VTRAAEAIFCFLFASAIALAMVDALPWAIAALITNLAVCIFILTKE
jgi:hypothetical protein